MANTPDIRKLMETCVDLALNASSLMNQGKIQVELLADLTEQIPDLAIEFESSGYDPDNYFGEVDAFSERRLVEVFGAQENTADNDDEMER